MTETPDEIVVPEDEVEDDLSLLDPDSTVGDPVVADDPHPDNDDELLSDE
jgi:hypothetical protein